LTGEARVHRFTIRVRYGDTDQMGFAYYGNYLRWFEIGRAEMMRALGRSYREIESRGVWLPVLEARCHYLKPARYDDEVVIETGVRELRRASVRFGYRILRNGSDELLAYGETEHCYMGPGERPVRPPQELLALLEAAPPARLPDPA
jgi:acyl-CoA thioester hydrolase